MAGTASMRLFQSTFPAGEATYDNNPILKWCMTFQSTLPVGEATPFMPEHRLEEHISIHAFRGESDPNSPTEPCPFKYFNPRFPRGKRPGMRVGEMLQLLFQSTLPAGEATRNESRRDAAVVISIHASRGGSDLTVPTAVRCIAIFQSTLPAGEATALPR